MSRAAVEQVLFLLDEAFERDDEHSLLGNLRDVRDDDWRWRPDGGGRSIRDIAEHAGIAKRLYADHLFGDATLDYAGVLAGHRALQQPFAPPKLVAWLREGHALLRAGVATLRDEELRAPARTHYGEVRERRAIIGVMVQHDAYHAGEINHLRALRQGTDAWPGVLPGAPAERDS